MYRRQVMAIRCGLPSATGVDVGCVYVFRGRQRLIRSVITKKMMMMS